MPGRKEEFSAGVARVRRKVMEAIDDERNGPLIMAALGEILGSVLATAPKDKVEILEESIFKCIRSSMKRTEELLSEEVIRN